MDSVISAYINTLATMMYSRKFQDSLDSQVVEVCTFWDYVDGEEGDSGVIQYKRKSDGALIATRIIHPGDDEEIEITPAGYQFFWQSIINYKAV